MGRRSGVTAVAARYSSAAMYRPGFSTQAGTPQLPDRGRVSVVLGDQEHDLEWAFDGPAPAAGERRRTGGGERVQFVEQGGVGAVESAMNGPGVVPGGRDHAQVAQRSLRRRGA